MNFAETIRAIKETLPSDRAFQLAIEYWDHRGGKDARSLTWLLWLSYPTQGVRIEAPTPKELLEKLRKHLRGEEDAKEPNVEAVGEVSL